MTRTIFASLLMAMASYSAHAAVAWQGDVIIDTATSACVAAGINSGTVIRSVLQPKNITGNTSNTIVTFNFNQVGEFALVIDHGAMPKGTGAAFGNNISGVLKANVGVKYSSFKQQPTSIVVSTPDATLEGKIEDFMFISNCDVKFRAAYTKNTSN